jgi:hypothetical protein
VPVCSRARRPLINRITKPGLRATSVKPLPTTIVTRAIPSSAAGRPRHSLRKRPMSHRRLVNSQLDKAPLHEFGSVWNVFQSNPHDRSQQECQDPNGEQVLHTHERAPEAAQSCSVQFLDFFTQEMDAEVWQRHAGHHDWLLFQFFDLSHSLLMNQIWLASDKRALNTRCARALVGDERVTLIGAAYWRNASPSHTRSASTCGFSHLRFCGEGTVRFFEHRAEERVQIFEHSCRLEHPSHTKKPPKGIRPWAGGFLAW